MRAALLLVVAAGCSKQFGLDKPLLEEAGAGALCDPLPFDAARYFVLTGAAGVSWSAARAGCQYRGFDLAVIDMGDSAEITNELDGGTLPFWLGVDSDGTSWNAIDTCTPVLAWANGEPVSSAVGHCVAQTAGGMRSGLCGETTVGGAQANGFCETPRPSAQCRAQAPQRTYMVPGGADVNADDAAGACAGFNMHLVEIDSSDELAYLVSHDAASVPRFWLGARRSGAGFSSPTGCPQVFTWGTNYPDGNDCVLYNGAMVSWPCNGTASVVCERNQ